MRRDRSYIDRGTNKLNRSSPPAIPRALGLDISLGLADDKAPKPSGTSKRVGSDQIGRQRPWRVPFFHHGIPASAPVEPQCRAVLRRMPPPKSPLRQESALFSMHTRRVLMFVSSCARSRSPNAQDHHQRCRHSNIRDGKDARDLQVWPGDFSANTTTNSISSTSPC